MTTSRRSLRIACAVSVLAITTVAISAPDASARPSAQRTFTWQGIDPSGPYTYGWRGAPHSFTTPANVSVPEGSAGWLEYCVEPGLVITGFTATFTRWHTEHTVTRAYAGTSTWPTIFNRTDFSLPPKTNVATDWIWTPDTDCIKAGTQATGTQKVSFDRAWTITPGVVRVADESGPEASGVTLFSTAVTNGWLRPDDIADVSTADQTSADALPVRADVSWFTDDNEHFRGTTGVTLSNGRTVDVGDVRGTATVGLMFNAPNGMGGDGRYLVSAYRSAPGWKTVSTEQIALNVDGTPPAVRATASAYDPAAHAVEASWSVKDATSGTSTSVAEIEVDGMWTPISATERGDGTHTGRLALSPELGNGTYRLRVVASDVAGNAVAERLPSITINRPDPAEEEMGEIAADDAQGGSASAPTTRRVLRASFPAGARSVTVARARRGVLIEGRLMRAGKPLRGARVVITGPGLRRLTSTNARGQFSARIRARAAGTVTVATPDRTARQRLIITRS